MSLYCDLRDQHCYQHHDHKQAPHLAPHHSYRRGGSVQQRKDTEVAYDADLVVVVCVHEGGMMKDNSNQFYKVWLFVHLLRKGNLYRGERAHMKGEKEFCVPSTDCSIELFCTAIHHRLTNSTKHN